LEGTLASIFGGTVIGLAFYLSNYLVPLSCSSHSGQWMLIPFGAVTGFVGSIVSKAVMVWGGS